MTLPWKWYQFANWAEPSIKQVSKAANRKDQKYHRSLFLPRPRFSRFAAHHSPLVRSRDVRSIALKTLGKERDCSQSNMKFIPMPQHWDGKNSKIPWWVIIWLPGYANGSFWDEKGSIKRPSFSEIILKGQCHEDFAVLGQFCAKIITLRL